jgi:hypothetical protein
LSFEVLSDKETTGLKRKSKHRGGGAKGGEQTNHQVASEVRKILIEKTVSGNQLLVRMTSKAASAS